MDLAQLANEIENLSRLDYADFDLRCKESGLPKGAKAFVTLLRSIDSKTIEAPRKATVSLPPTARANPAPQSAVEPPVIETADG